MYHTAAYTGSIALTSTKQPLNALTDSVMRIGSANGFVLQEDMMFVAGRGSGVGIANLNLQSPKVLQFSPYFITPVDTTLAAANPDIAMIVPHRALTFRAQEELVAQVDNTNAGAQQMTLVVHLATKIDPLPAGEMLTLTGTATTAAVANTWTQVQVTMGQVLPEGVYVMIGSEHQSTTAVAHRFTFLNGQVYRPGHVSTTSFSNRQSDAMKWGTLGSMGTFSNVSLWNTEVLCGAADATHTFRFRVIKVQ